MSKSQVHEFNVKMSCGGCSSAVEKVLSKFEGKGIDKVEINMTDQIVKVTGSLPAEEILKLIQKTGKEVQHIASQ
ncbi:hypothetical protein FQR65_LT00589 [Abscondita terminalis]|nr:hypothetical protein FQR65_LT00589 [Abscondita terminalis]